MSTLAYRSCEVFLAMVGVWLLVQGLLLAGKAQEYIEKQPLSFAVPGTALGQGKVLTEYPTAGPTPATVNMGAESVGNNVYRKASGGEAPLATAVQPPMKDWQAQDFGDRGQSSELAVSVTRSASSSLAPEPAPTRVYQGLIYDLNKPALMLPEPLAALVECESSNNPFAVGDNGQSIGLLQVHVPSHRDLLARLHVTREDLFRPEVNAFVASEIWRESGIEAWSCAR